MKPRISLITLGVTNLEKSVAFYRDGLKLKTDGIIGKEFEYGAVAFFDLQNGLKLALWPKESISKDTNITGQTPSSLEFTIGHNVNNKEEVDTVMKEAEMQEQKLSNLHKTHSMVVMQATSKTPTDICGKWPGIRHLRLMSRSKTLSVTAFRQC